MERKRDCFRVLDLFAGIGGLSFGLELVKAPSGSSAFELACAVEIDPDACNTLKANLKKGGKDPSIVLQADLTNSETHDTILELCNGSVDVLVGGPPCQSFSSIGSRSAAPPVRRKFENDDRDRLYLEYIALVRELKPTFIVFENVMGILTKKDPTRRRYVDLVVEAIGDCGYTLGFEGMSEKHLVLDSADFGVPQFRKRVIVIANRLGLPNPTPIRTHSKDGKENGTLPYVTLRDAIGDLPPLEAPMTFCDIPEAERATVKARNANCSRGEEAASFDWLNFDNHYQSLGRSGRLFLDYIRPRTEHYLTAHVARGQQKSDLELFQMMPPGSTSKDLLASSDPEMQRLRSLIKYDMDSFRDKYRKHEWDKPCTTIFAHLQRDGNRFIHPDQPRSFTVREAARIQSFPDDFVFTATGNLRFRYIGNAVPPLLSRAIGEAIYKVLHHAG